MKLFHCCIDFTRVFLPSLLPLNKIRNKMDDLFRIYCISGFVHWLIDKLNENIL